MTQGREINGNPSNRQPSIACRLKQIEDAVAIQFEARLTIVQLKREAKLSAILELTATCKHPHKTHVITCSFVLTDNLFNGIKNHVMQFELR